MASTSDLDPYPKSQHIFNRKYILCDQLKDNFDTHELIGSCPDCSYFLATCCQHYKQTRARTCHHFQLVFTDGACRDNGRLGASAGLGIAFGREPDQQFSIPVDDAVDPGGKRTSQRAELLAALEAVRRLKDMSPTPHEQLYNRHSKTAGDDAMKKAQWIITTDSQYVVNGMTDWLPNKWRVRS